MRINVELDHHHPRADGTCLVRLTFYDGKLQRYPLGVHVTVKNWDRSRKRVRFGAPSFNIYNAQIEAEYQRAERIAFDRPGISAKDLKMAMGAKQPDGGTFYEVAKLDIENTPPGSWHTTRQRISALNIFDSWSPGIATKDISTVTMEDYYNHRRKTVSHNTAASNLSILRTIYKRVCRRSGVAPVDILETVDAVERYKERPSQLDAQEVACLMAYADGKKGWAAKSVHMWLFSFYCCGVRWGDECRLKVSELAGGRIRTEQNKTDESKNVALHPYAVKVSELYRCGEYVFGIAGDKEPTDLQIASANVIANRELKRAAKSCGINKRMHTHNARHSFAGMALDASIDDRAIRAAMGIGEQAYKHYKGVIRPAVVDEQIAQVWKNMEG